MNLSREEGSMLELFSSNAQNSGAASVGPMAFKMSLVLGKVSKVMSCEIRAQAKKRRHVSYFKFIRNNICSVDLFISIFYRRIKPAGRPDRGVLHSSEGALLSNKCDRFQQLRYQNQQVHH